MKNSGPIPVWTRVSRNTAMIALLVVGAAAAPTVCTAAESPGEQSSSTTIDEIVVTAQKREERLQDVPIAITAVTGATLDRYNITDVTGLTKITPNVIIEPVSVGPTSATFFIRGEGERAQEPLNDSPNALSVDGVYLVGFSGALLDTFDVQQIEVLRGPQGTLQGRNAVGGAVNVTSIRPTFEDHAAAEVGYGNYEDLEGKFMLEGALIPSIVAGKIAFTTENREGYIRNTTVPDSPGGSVENYFTRAGLLITPNEKTDIYLTFDYQLSRPGQAQHSAEDGQSYPRSQTDGQTISANCAVFHYCTPDANWTSSINFPAKALLEAGGLAANINIDLGAVKLTSISGFRRTAEHENVDLDASSTDEFIVDNRHLVQNQFSQEVRLASQRGGGLDFGDKLDWVVGLYQLHQHFDLNEPVFLNSQAEGIPTGVCSGIPGTVSNLPTPGCYLDLADYRQQWVDSYAGFAHVTWSFTDEFNIFGGVRYTHDHKDFHQESQVGGDLVTQPGFVYDKSYKNTSFDAGTQYKITPSNIAYFHFSQGYRAGGFNSDGVANVPDSYKAETVNSYEVGLKSEFLDRRLSVNTAVFRADYKDMDRDVVHFLTTQIVQSIQNAAAARIQGVEIEAVGVPVTDLKVLLSLGYLDAKYLSYVDDGVDDSALRLPFTPKVTASLGVDYTVHMPALFVFTQITPGVDVQYKSAYTTAPTDDPVNAQAAYAMLNGQVEMSDDAHKYAVVLWANNITDKHIIFNGEIDGNLSHIQTEGLPRMYGIRFRVNF